MKKKHFISLVALSALMLVGCNKTQEVAQLDANDEPIKGPVAGYTDSLFYDNELISVEVCEYDENGRLLVTKEYDASDGAARLWEIRTNEYDANGKLAHTLIQHPLLDEESDSVYQALGVKEGDTDIKIDYFYEGDRLVTEIMVDSYVDLTTNKLTQSADTTRYEYEEKADGGYIKKLVYEYGTEGRIHYDAQGRMVETEYPDGGSKKTYDAKTGLLSSEENVEYESETKITYTYKMDDKGNWIEQDEVMKSNGEEEAHYLTKRTIQYK